MSKRHTSIFRFVDNFKKNEGNAHLNIKQAIFVIQKYEGNAHL